MSRRSIFHSLLGSKEHIKTTLDYDGQVYEMSRDAHEQFAIQFANELGKPPSKNLKNIQRRNMLLGYLVANSVDKLQVDSYDAHLDAAQVIFENEDDVTCFVSDAGKSLAKATPGSFAGEVVAFHKRKNKAQRTRTKKLEMMREFDIEDVNMVDPSARKSYSKYETSESLIKGLLEGIEENNIEVLVSDETTLTPEHRRNQAKFGHALLNVEGRHIVMIKDLFRRYKRYKELTTYEMALIQIVFFQSDDRRLKSIGVYDMIINDFPFAIERYLLEEGYKILDGDSAENQAELLEDLKGCPSFIKLKQRCEENVRLNCKVKTILNQMYILSGCDNSMLLFRKMFL